MINYAQLRANARTGDLLALKGRGIASYLVRIFTATSWSHVAVLLWVDEGLWVCEMAWSGYRMRPASQWVPEQSADVWWCRAPEFIKEECATEVLLAHRGRPYSYWSLITTWISNLLNRRLPSGDICSELAQNLVESCGGKRQKSLWTPDDAVTFWGSATRIS